MLEFYSCILAVLFIGLICSLIVHRSHRKEGGDSGDSYGRKLGAETRRLKQARKAASQQHSQDRLRWAKRDSELRPLRELHSVRTPWGWPQPFADKGKRSSGVMKSFTAGLLRQDKRQERRTKESRAEERFFASNWNSPKEIEYRKVKAPLLRDPNAPHDQMDNFGIKQVEVVRRKLQPEVKMKVEAAAGKKVIVRYVNLKDIKQPWGW